MIFWDW